MSNYFDNPKTLMKWVKNNSSIAKAVERIMLALGEKGDAHEEDVTECCERIILNDSFSSAQILFKILAQHGIAKFNKESKMTDKQIKEAQAARPRSKWNRVIEGFNEGTPWRRARDEMYDFTHYYQDEVSFDEDPERVYSGEALWRMYVMDKFSSDYHDKDGKLVGGYINDRFHVFPTAGTPANPNVPRDGGNPMSLANGERSKKPRPHEYNYERRLEESRGNKLESIEVTASNFERRIKVASKLPEERNEDKIYNIFKDCLDMREAGFEYGDMINKVANHYNMSLINVAQIDRTARKLKDRHQEIGYEVELTSDYKKKITKAQATPAGESAMQVVKEVNVFNPMTGQVVTLEPNSFVVLRPGIDVMEGQVLSGENAGLIFQLNDLDSTSFVEQAMPMEKMNEAYDDVEELGLNEEPQQIDQPEAKTEEIVPMENEFEVDDMGMGNKLSNMPNS